MSDRTNRSTLTKPTVGDVIAFLSGYPPSTPFRIEDPDTDWTISIIHTFEEGGKVWFTGEYSEMGDEE